MSRRAVGGRFSLRTILLILAVVCFAIVAFGINVDIGDVNFGGLGLAFFAAALIFP
jgi:hypothetical protein